MVRCAVLGQWKLMVPLYIVYGYARCTFEGQNPSRLLTRSGKSELLHRSQ